MLARLWQQWPSALQQLRYSRGLGRTCPAYSTDQAANKKPYISQKVKFVDKLRVVARGGQGGGGSSALFGRTGHHPRAAGGNGAPGGSVVLRATGQLTGLGSIPLHVEAERGGHGGKQWMEGKRGADRVVPVPLGTMVWRLVQVAGSGAQTPHGVTPIPAAAAATAQQPRNQHGTAHHAGRQPLAPETTQQQQHEAGVSSSSHSRRKLFGEPCDAASSQTAPATAIATAQPEGSLPVRGTARASSHSSAGNFSQQQGQMQDTYLDSFDSLFDDLVSGRVALSNQEKLQLLQHGCLGGPAGDLLDWDDDSTDLQTRGDEDDDSSSSSGSASDGDEDESQQEDDSWRQKQQHRIEGGPRDYGNERDVETRQFDKQEVWSILSAQAELLGVLESEGQELVVATGGRGGRGNASAPSNHHRPASRVRSDGHPGQEVMLLLQLRLMADVALVGLPNVGKSSLIAALTGARAQVGSYAFTTLRPQLGTLLPTVPDAHPSTQAAQHHPSQPYTDTATPQHEDSNALAAAAAAGDDDSGLTGHKLVLADLPGLVPGAHEGKGRGIDFLKHLLKARCIALVVDMTGKSAGSKGATSSSSGNDSRAEEQGFALEGSPGQGDSWEALVPHTPKQQLRILLDELRCFEPKTMSMPMLVVANKVDAMSASEAAQALQRLKLATNLPIVPVSAQQHLGLMRLKQSLELLAGTSANACG